MHSLSEASPYPLPASLVESSTLEGAHCFGVEGATSALRGEVAGGSREAAAPIPQQTETHVHLGAAATGVSSFSQTPGLEQLGSIPCVPIAVKPLNEAFIERGHFQSSSTCVLKIKQTLVREENTHTGRGGGRNLTTPGSSELGPPVEGGTRGTQGRQLCLATQPGALKSKPDPSVTFFSTTKEVRVHFFKFERY